jgi:hypothetical protein
MKTNFGKSLASAPAGNVSDIAGFGSNARI